MRTKIVILLALAPLLTAQPGVGQASQRAASLDRMIPRVAFAAIKITEPTEGETPPPAGTAVAVRAIASGATELDWLELWANDRRVGVQPAPKGGLKTLTGVFAWTPDAAGTYSLVARAVDGQDRTVTSTAVDVIVSAAVAPRGGLDQEAAKQRPTTLGNGVGSERTMEPATLRLAAASGRTAAARDLVVAERWQPGTPGRRSAAPAASRPGAPVLTAETAGKCQVVLNLHETTGRADGYAVYRQSPAGLGWVRVAILHGAAEGKGLTFTDGAFPGRLHYYVAAFNERGETVSNPVALDMDSRDCPMTVRESGGTPIFKHGGPPIQEHPDKRMPKVEARISHSVDQCKSHLPGKGSNALEAILFCTPFPEYNDEGKQAYLVWSTDDAVCANGNAGRGVDCKGLDYYVSRAETYGGHVGFRLSYEHNDGPIAGVGYPDYATTGYDRTSYVVPPLEPYDPSADQFNLCGSEITYNVELVYDAGPNDPEFANFLMVGPLAGAADWRFTCPPPPSYEVTGEQVLDVKIGTLHLGDVDDGDSGDFDDVEVYGLFRIWTANTDVPVPAIVLKSGLFKKVGFRNFGTWGEPPGDCFTEAFELPATLASSSGGECHRSLHAGDHPVSEFLLCDTCSSVYDNNGPWSQNKNVIRIAVREGEAVYIETLIMDYDSGSADDPQCVGVVNTERHLLESWSKFDSPITMTQKDNGNSSCTVTFRISAVK